MSETQKTHSEPTYWRDDPTTGEIEPDPKGDWVRREAYQDLEEQLEALRKAVEFALPVLQAYSIYADDEGFQTSASHMHEAHEVLARALSNPASEPEVSS